jgi:GNAT superfamily N-acetyltransferase
MKIGIATPSDYEDIAALYAEAGYGAEVEPADLVIVAKSDGQLAGVVRLCDEHGVIVLRGMQIRRAAQRQGIGAQMLAACRPYLDQRVSYCLPYSHLVSFYGAAGFVVVDGAGLPDFLSRRLASYLRDGKDVIAMRRVPPNQLIAGYSSAATTGARRC